MILPFRFFEFPLGGLWRNFSVISGDGKRSSIVWRRWTLHPECRRQQFLIQCLDYVLYSNKGRGSGGGIGAGSGLTGGLADLFGPSKTVINHSVFDVFWKKRQGINFII